MLFIQCIMLFATLLSKALFYPDYAYQRQTTVLLLVILLSFLQVQLAEDHYFIVIIIVALYENLRASCGHVTAAHPPLQNSSKFLKKSSSLCECLRSVFEYVIRWLIFVPQALTSFCNFSIMSRRQLFERQIMLSTE